MEAALQLLEVVSSILEGASLPLSQEQADLVERVLLPLHRADTYTTFAPQLIHCCCQVGKRKGEVKKLPSRGKPSGIICALDT